MTLLQPLDVARLHPTIHSKEVAEAEYGAWFARLVADASERRKVLLDLAIMREMGNPMLFVQWVECDVPVSEVGNV